VNCFTALFSFLLRGKAGQLFPYTTENKRNFRARHNSLAADIVKIVKYKNLMIPIKTLEKAKKREKTIKFTLN